MSLSVKLLAGYYVRGNFCCNRSNIIYLISCKNCEHQYIGSAIDFKTRFMIHKSNIKTKKDLHRFLQVQLVLSVVSDLDLENKLWEREKYWQCQLFTNTHGMNSVSDLYASKRKRI